MLKARLYEHEIQKREKENLKDTNLKDGYWMGASNSFICFTTLST